MLGSFGHVRLTRTCSSVDPIGPCAGVEGTGPKKQYRHFFLIRAATSSEKSTLLFNPS